MHYGSRKSFEFELKQRLEEARYNDLWLRLNQSKGLKILNSYRDTKILLTSVHDRGKEVP
jgi:hypothetical protein